MLSIISNYKFYLRKERKNEHTRHKPQVAYAGKTRLFGRFSSADDSDVNSNVFSAIFLCQHSGIVWRCSRDYHPDRKSLGLYQRSADGIAGRKVEQTRWNLFVVDEAGPDSNRNFYGTMFFCAESVLYHESSLGGSNLYLPRHVADRLFDTNECPAAEADNRQNRKSKLGTYGGVASSILNAIVPAVTMPLVAMLSTSNPATAFTKLAAIYACVYLLMGFLGILGCRGYEINDYDKEKGENAPAPTVKEMFAALVQNKVSGVVFLIQVVKMLFSSLQGSMLLYFCTYNLGNANIMSVTTSVGVIFTIGATLLMVPRYIRSWEMPELVF